MAVLQTGAIEERSEHFFSFENSVRVFSSLISVASSNVSPATFGALTRRMNSRDLLHRYFFPRQTMSFNPLVDQFATEVKTAPDGGGRRVFQRSVTTGCRVESHFNP